jgi:hypothetical protein
MFGLNPGRAAFNYYQIRFDYFAFLDHSTNSMTRKRTERLFIDESVPIQIEWTSAAVGRCTVLALC